jgi:hypothetical protein
MSSGVLDLRPPTCLSMMLDFQPRRLLMKKLTLLSPGLCLLFLSSMFASAQDGMGGAMPPPKVLLIQREYLKPGKSGSMHEKTESAFVRAMSAAKWPTHYFAADSLSGPSRSLFFIGYPSFEAMEKDTMAQAKNPTLSAAFDRASIADGDLLTEYDSGVFVSRDDLSLRSSVDIAQFRYFEIMYFTVKPGHTKEWEEMVKMYHDGYQKAVPEAQWATFESTFGQNNGGVYLIFIPMKSLAEMDTRFADDKKLSGALGETGMKKMAELEAMCVESQQSNLFQFNPKISYPPDEWVKADAFWKPKPAASPVAKPAQ